ncbi:PREDICTED: uncharacterized protein LOC108617917 isoform X1 [Drosophila arizonae]|uniref:Uncharacterized protein LOC108617917 isoform X1 n=1 Tax=Drosophila arizonae TaxID=7263 RepID=A0ABM1PPY8_DROAR|nr:PREDICTED: uncharacterized protein LOC108617917 isoform X1 [Drosophila arizonae]
MHSLHSLRSPRTGIPTGSGAHPLYNLNLLSPNYSSKQPQQQQQHQQQQPQQHVTNASLPSDISYIDEDPQQQQRTLQNGSTSTSDTHQSHLPFTHSSARPTGSGFSDAVHSLQAGNGQNETRI